MNYIKELNAFKNWLLLHEIPTGAIVLWHTLMIINNATGWKREFNAPNSLVRKLSGLSKQGLLNARKHLIAHKRIHCKKGKKGQAPVYEMVPFVGEADQSTSFVMSQTSSRSANQAVPNEGARIRHEGSASESASGPDVSTEALSTFHLNDQSSDPSISHSGTQLVDSSTSHADPPIVDSFPSRSDAHQSTLSIDHMDEGSRDGSSTDSNARSWPIPKQKQKKKQASSRVRTSPDVLTMFEQNIGKLRPVTADLLRAWCVERSAAVVQAAIELAVKRGGRTFRYVEAILREWAQADITTVEAMHAYESKKRSRSRDLNTVSFRGRETRENKDIFDELRQEEA